METARLQQLLEQFSSRRILVIGDLMLDRFIWGRVSRISPEAPVPVVEVTQESSYPGGAANVARNLRAFCANIQITGLTGNDAEGRELARLLEDEGISTDGILADEAGFTTVKTRVFARQQQVVRFDRERRDGASPDIMAGAMERVAGLLKDADAVIFEDYGKGFLGSEFVTRAITLANEAGCLVIADPNPNNSLDWRGATCVKPNRHEAFAAAGMPQAEPADDPLQDAQLLEVADILLARWDVESLLITLGEHGMLLVRKGHPPYHTPTRAREVFDVSGAGDTAIALFTLALAAGAEMAEAAEIANYASGVVVGKLGTATLTPAELLESLSRG